MGRKVTVACCTLNQWALDFEGNVARILQSILEAREHGATYRTGPELEVPGYSCEDHFFESDTFLHSWEALLEIMMSPICHNMLVDVGMPVQHCQVNYNCRVVFYNKKIVLIRPKVMMCDDFNYRETRWFSAWLKPKVIEDYYLPKIISNATGQFVVPFGDGIVVTKETSIGFEICEELWNPRSTHIDFSLSGVEIMCNGSGSYVQLRKTYVTTELVRNASFKAGGLYLFSNLRGCDGGRLWWGGNTVAALNGDVIARSKQFSLSDVEIVVATVDLEDIRTYRMHLRSRCTLTGSTPMYPRITVDCELSSRADIFLATTGPMEFIYHSPEEEIAYAPACWMWDYLRRSGQGGFFLPLSGGVDSSSTAALVHSMCRMVVDAIQHGEPQVLHDVRKILADPDFTPHNAGQLCNRLLVTCYMGSENSSKETRRRASMLANQVGSYHLEINIDGAVSSMLSIFSAVTGLTPKFRTQGGCPRQNLALQNIQARSRMVLSYLFAQLMLWVRNRPGGLLVLGSANVDEGLRGYMTKYDCSSADINPIGGISKVDLRKFLNFAMDKFNLPILSEIIAAPPTAELEPLKDGQLAQTDEQDMGMTYSELSEFGKLRKLSACGPYSMFCKLVASWRNECAPKEVADKVKHFFRCYAINRHKMTVLTPSVHMENYSPDDNRFDHRPFLYRANWSWQFKAIDDELDRITKGSSMPTRSDKSEPELSEILKPSGADKQTHDTHAKIEKQASSPVTFGSHYPGGQYGEQVVTNGMSGALSSGTINVNEKQPTLKKSHSTGYSKVQGGNVMGRIKDRTGVPV